MSDVSVTDHAHSSNSESGKWDFHGDASGSLGFFSVSADTNARGSHSGSSTSDFLRQLSTHASASAHQSVRATHASASLSVGEVTSRTHTEGESEDHFESSSREFRNENRCHAVTFYFYRLLKKQIVTLTLERVERRIDDPAAPTAVSPNPPVSRGQISVVPQSVLATQANRVAVEQVGRESVAAQDRHAFPATFTGGSNVLFPFVAAAPPISDAMRKQALEQVDKDLVTAGLLTAPGGVVAPKAQEAFRVTVESCLPTPGLIVRGCLDDCDVCEPALQRKIELELENMDLKNKLLARQIELLDKAQEYRCCPEGEEATP